MFRSLHNLSSKCPFCFYQITHISDNTFKEVDDEVSFLNFIEIQRLEQDSSEYEANLGLQEAAYLESLSPEEMAERDRAFDEWTRLMRR